MTEHRYVPNDLLSRLVGLQLYSVNFIVDHIQLRFSESGKEDVFLNCDVMPLVEFEGAKYRENDFGYGDALRRLVPGEVIETQEATGIGLRVKFENGSISLHPSLDEIHVEIAMLGGFGDGAWMVWRPGEYSFEDLV